MGQWYKEKRKGLQFRDSTMLFHQLKHGSQFKDLGKAIDNHYRKEIEEEMTDEHEGLKSRAFHSKKRFEKQGRWY